MSNIDLENDIRQIVTFPDSSTSGTDGVDAILAPIFRDVLDHDAGREFTERLDALSAEKVAEIERMCNSNHQEFVGAVEKLLKARKGAAGLRVQSNVSGAPFSKCASDGTEWRHAKIRECLDGGYAAANRSSNNIGEYRRSNRYIEGISPLNMQLLIPQKCLRVLGLANRIHELIERRKNYAALRALDGTCLWYATS
jgi:exocyst complex component 6